MKETRLFYKGLMKIELGLEAWKQALLVFTGATVTLLATAIANIPEEHHMVSVGWYAIWLMIQLAVTPPAIMLTMSKKWRTIHLRDRLDTEFGFIILAWAAALAFVIRTTSIASFEMNGYLVCARFILIISGGSLFVSYLVIKTRVRAKLDNLFP